MRLTFMTVLCSLAMVAGNSTVGSQSVRKSDISFGLPIVCGAPEKPRLRSFVDDEGDCEGRCLADSYEPGLDVALVDETGVCRARTGDKCKFRFSYGLEPVTQLVGTKPCLAVRKQEELFRGKHFHIAIVRVDPATVRSIKPNTYQSALPDDVISWARQLLESSSNSDSSSEHVFRLSSPLPRVLRVKNVALLEFGFIRDAHGQERALLLLFNNRLFRLGRMGCPGNYGFFTVKDKLHLSFWDSCCGCGIVDKVVYDLSKETPELVYDNGSFGD